MVVVALGYKDRGCGGGLCRYICGVLEVENQCGLEHVVRPLQKAASIQEIAARSDDDSASQMRLVVGVGGRPISPG